MCGIKQEQTHIMKYHVIKRCKKNWPTQSKVLLTILSCCLSEFAALLRKILHRSTLCDLDVLSVPVASKNRHSNMTPSNILETVNKKLGCDGLVAT